MVNTKKLRTLASLMALGACGIGLTALTHYATAAVPATHTQTAAKAATASSPGLAIGTFEGKIVSSGRGTYVPIAADGGGWGWVATSDQREGGKSTASIAIVHPGAGGTKGALQTTGELKSGFISPFAGALWFPGSRPMKAADLSGHKDLVFWAKGKPGNYSLMMMAGSTNNMPVYASFEMTKDWKKYTIPLASFVGADLKHVYFIAVSVGDYGKYQFELDQVLLH